MVVAQRIRELREAAGLSARELSRLAKLPSPSHVALIESNKKDSPLSTATATALARVLGCTLDWLVNGTGKGPSVRAVRTAVDVARGEIDAA